MPRTAIAKAERLLAEAAGAELVVFPEAFIGGYPKGQDFGPRVGARTPEGRKIFQRYYDGAIDVSGPATARLGEAARECTYGVTTNFRERGCRINSKPAYSHSRKFC